MRLNNFREIKPEDSLIHGADAVNLSGIEENVSKSGEPKEDPINSGAASTMETFALEDIPAKIPLVDPRPDSEISIILYHSEA